MSEEKVYGEIKGPYSQKSIKKRIEALLLDNIGKIITREQIIAVAKDPRTGIEPENWHQRLSELRTDDGYTILSNRDRSDLKVAEYLLVDSSKRDTVNKRIMPSKDCWKTVLLRAGNKCEWEEGGQLCGLKDGDKDPIGGGTVKLTPDHMTPHSTGNNVDPNNPNDWRALCGRHQVMKKNYWDNTTGKFNTVAILQASTINEKEIAYKFLKEYFEKK